MKKIHYNEMMDTNNVEPDHTVSTRILCYNDTFGYFILKWSEGDQDWVNPDGTEYVIAIHLFTYLVR